jgi:hypothetical protein
MQYKLSKNHALIHFMIRITIVLLFTITFSIVKLSAFSLLSHEAIIDKTWESSIKPLLKAKFPTATPEQLDTAHSYLYGGSIMADIGYYPFGSIQFTNLVHYVRTGDFINNALLESENINEYAFSLGLLCHYYADQYGHSLGTNLAVPVLFPKSKKKHGDCVTYEQEKSQHTRTEFGFDVIQTAKGNYESKNKQDFIGFRISEPVLKRAVLKTYGIKLESMFKSLPVAVETFRFTVKYLFPEMAKDAWKVRKSVITQINPLAEKAIYTQKTDKKTFRTEFGKPQFKSWIGTLMIGLVPKVGPLSGLKFKEPNTGVEKIFNNSFQTIVEKYEENVRKLEQNKPHFPNINCDTGKLTEAGEYKMADECHYKWLKRQKRDDYKNTDKHITKALISFYSNPSVLAIYKKKKHKLKTINAAIAQLKKSPAAPSAEIQNQPGVFK